MHMKQQLMQLHKIYYEDKLNKTRILPLTKLPPMGLGMLLLLGRLTGLVLLAGKRLWVGDVGDFTGSTVLGRDERFSGCAAASSYNSLT